MDTTQIANDATTAIMTVQLGAMALCGIIVIVAFVLLIRELTR